MSKIYVMIISSYSTDTDYFQMDFNQLLDKVGSVFRPERSNRAWFLDLFINIASCICWSKIMIVEFELSKLSYVTDENMGTSILQVKCEWNWSHRVFQISVKYVWPKIRSGFRIKTVAMLKKKNKSSSYK